jgi:hypothetical protein
MRGVNKRSPPAADAASRRLAACLCLGVGLALLLTSSFGGTARAALASLTISSVETYNHDGSPGGGTVDFGEVYPGTQVTISPAVVLHVTSELEWQLDMWSEALPAGCVLEQRIQSIGSWTLVSPAVQTLLEAEPPCDNAPYPQDLRLSPEWTAAPGTWTVTITYQADFTDKTPPSGAVSINDGATHTNDPSVTLHLTASDESGLDAMRFSDDGVSWSAWQDFAPTAPWTLPSGDGEKTVWAVFRDRAGNESSPVSDTIILDTVPPVISGETVTDVTATTADITWQTDEEADGQVEYGPDTSYGSLSPRDTSYVTERTVTLTGLEPATLYHFRAISADRAGNETTGSDHTLTTLCAAPELSVSCRRIFWTLYAQLSWNSPAGAVSFNLYRRDVLAGDPFTLLTSTTSTWHLDPLPSSPPYEFEYYVAAVDSQGRESAPSNIVSVSGTEEPPVISNVQSDPADTTCLVTWDTDEAATSQVRYGTSPGTYTHETPQDTSLVTSHAVSLSGLDPETTYYFVVVSEDAQGNESQSEEHTFTTLPLSNEPPPPPENLRVTGTFWWFAELAWDPAPSAELYYVYARDASDPGASWELVNPDGTTETTYVTLIPYPSTDFCVTAWNQNGESGYSDPINVER